MHWSRGHFRFCKPNTFCRPHVYIHVSFPRNACPGEGKKERRKEKEEKSHTGMAEVTEPETETDRDRKRERLPRCTSVV